MDVGSRQRVSRIAWCDAALEQIADGGVASVSMEGLARRLGVTKGSGYWHFADRADLISSSLDYWAEQSTTAVIGALSTIPDPRARLRTLLATSLDDDRSALDARLATSVADPEVAEVVERLTEQRLAFLRTIFSELGFDGESAQRRALLAYAAYIGHVQLAHLDPASFDAVATIDEMLVTLAGSAGDVDQSQ